MSRPFRYESDPPFLLRITGIGLVSIGIIFIGALWAWWILSSEARRRVPGGEEIPREVQRPEVGMVIKTLYTTDTRFNDERKRQQAELQRWSWVDRKQKRVRMPIDRAMAELVGSNGPARTSVHGTD